MKPLWTTWRCRHNANLFMLTLAGFFGSLAVIAVLCRNGIPGKLVLALPVIGGYLVLWAVRVVQRARVQRGRHLENLPLSRDEWRKARSKLVKNRKGT